MKMVAKRNIYDEELGEGLFWRPIGMGRIAVVEARDD
jgi:hypothetical protein